MQTQDQQYTHDSQQYFKKGSSSKDYLRLTALREKISHREHCRSEIIKKIVDLANVMPLAFPFVTYDHESHFHRLNVSTFVKNLRTTEYYWIAIAYCPATEYMVYDPPPRYIDG